MNRFLATVLAAGLLAGCGQKGPDAEADKWRAAGTLFLEVDGAAYMKDLERALAAGKPTDTTSVPPVYKTRYGFLVVWMEEADVPARTSYRPMSPHQLMEAALGFNGICVDEGGECATRLSRDEVWALEARMAKDGVKDQAFALKRKS